MARSACECSKHSYWEGSSQQTLVVYVLSAYYQYSNSSIAWPTASILHGACRVHSAAPRCGWRQHGDCEQPASHRSCSAGHRQHAQAHHSTACCCQARPRGAAACADAGGLQSSGNHLRRQVSVFTLLCMLGTHSVPLHVGALLTPLPVVFSLSPLQIVDFLRSFCVVDAFLPFHAVVSGSQNIDVCVGVCVCACMPAFSCAEADCLTSPHLS